MMARMAEPHILLTVVAGTLAGMPAPSAAWRAGAWPRPADRTQPMMTSSTSPAGMPESASAALTATDPSCGPVTAAKTPWKAPTGVRRADRMTIESELMSVFRKALGTLQVYNGWPAYPDRERARRLQQPAVLAPLGNTA